MTDHMYTPDLKLLSKLHIELSSKCNANCGSCSRNYNGGSEVPGLILQDLSIHDIEKMIPEHLAKNIKFINFCGNLGDPGMAPDLLKILEYFRGHNPYVIQHVRTNGGMRGHKFWGEVGEFFASQRPEDFTDHAGKIDFPFNTASVVWSVDGLEDTNHIYRRGVKWEKLWANMNAYSQSGATAVWEFLVFDHNEHQIEEAMSMAYDLGFKFALKTPMGFERDGEQKGMLIYDKQGQYDYTIYPQGYNGSRAEPTQSYNIIAKSNTRFEVPELSQYSSELGKTSTIKCRSLAQVSKESSFGQEEIYIASTGHLLPCCFLGGTLTGDMRSKYSNYQFIQEFENIGSDVFDLRKNSIEEIIYNEKFSSLFLDGWKAKSVEEGRLLFCVEMCGECSPLKKLYQTGGGRESNYNTEQRNIQ